jgi:hypothetical protein
MTALEQYRERPAEVAIPPAAAGLVEWATQADAAYRLAQKLVGTSFAPQAFRGKADEAAAAMLAGAEVGLSPMASLGAFDVIQGRAAPRAITLRAIVQAQGHEMVIDEASPVRCVMRGRRRGSEEWQPVTWTIERARDLGLTTKDQWKKQPQTMLIARATSELARLIAADAILGIGYSVEEMQDEAGEVTPIKRAPSRVQRAPKPQAPEPEFDELPGQEAVKAVSEAGITDAQMKALHAALRDANLSDRDAGLAYIGDLLGHEITTTKDLTKSDASFVIDTLKREAETPAEPMLPEDGAA